MTNKKATPSPETIDLGAVVSINPDSVGKDFRFETIKYIDITSVGSGTLNGLSEIKFSQAPSRAKRLVNNGDTILSTVRPNRRSFLYVKNPELNIVVSTGFAVLRATDKIDSRYLYYTITHQAFTDYLTNNAKGAAYPAVDADTIGRAEIWLPPLPTQRKIAAILSAYDDLIENNLQRIRILEEMAQLIYREWFVNFRFPGHEKAKMVDSELRMIPEGWEVTTFRDLFRIEYGKTLPVKEMSSDGEYPVYGAGGIIGYHRKCVAQEKVALVTCRGNGSGTVWRTRGPAFITNNSLLLLPKDNFVNLEYYFVETLAKHSNVKGALSGSAQPQITIEGLSAVPTILPQPSLVCAYCDLVRHIPELVDQIYGENINLRRTHDLLLPKLISGELDVSGLDLDTEGDDEDL